MSDKSEKSDIGDKMEDFTGIGTETDNWYKSDQHDNLPEGDVCDEGCDWCLGDGSEIILILDETDI